MLKIVENLWPSCSPPDSPTGGMRLLPLPKNHTPTLGHFGPSALPPMKTPGHAPGPCSALIALVAAACGYRHDDAANDNDEDARQQRSI